MKVKIKILIPIILCLTLSFSVCAQSFDDLEPITDRENSISIFEDIESENEIPQTSSKTTKDDVINTILFTLGLKVPDEAKGNSIYDGFISWLGSRNLSAANQLDNLTNNYITTQPYGIGQVFNITRKLWNELRNETSNGVSFDINVNSGQMSFANFYNTWIDQNQGYQTMESAYDTPWTIVWQTTGNQSSKGYVNCYTNTNGPIVIFDNTPYLKLDDQSVNSIMRYSSNVQRYITDRNIFTGFASDSNIITQNGIKYVRCGERNWNWVIIGSSSGSTTNIHYDKFDGRSNLSDDSDYNVISKSDNLDAPIWNSSGDAPSHTHLQSSDIQMNIVNSDDLADISEKIDSNQSDLTDEMVQNVGVAPYDDSTGLALNGLELAAIGAAMMNVVTQDLGQSIFENAWNTIETFSFSLPSQSFVNVALWLSQQMETLLYLTDFNQVFTMTCILLVACSLVGLTRLWKSAPNDTPDRTYRKPSQSKRKEK